MYGATILFCVIGDFAISKFQEYHFATRTIFWSFALLTQQTRDLHPMLFQCWASVEDGGPALEQHWVNVLCLLGNESGFSSPLCTYRPWEHHEVRWMRWHCPPDTEFEIRALAVWGRARYLSVMEASHNIESIRVNREETFCFVEFWRSEWGSNPRSRLPSRQLWPLHQAPRLCFTNFACVPFRTKASRMSSSW